MSVRVFVNGRITGPEDALISVFDRGFLFGDSVYETMRTFRGKPVDLEAHLERLERSAASLVLSTPSREVLEEAIALTLAEADNEESNVRVVVTRGAGDIGLATDLAAESTNIVIVRPLVLPAPEFYLSGAKLAVVDVQRTPRRAVDPRIKSGNYLNNIMALAEARRLGADEAIMLDANGRVTEGSTSNVFVVQDGRVLTPSLDVGLLDGITRRRVCELAREIGIPVDEAEMVPDDLFLADEVFITSSVRAVMPISDVSGKKPAEGAPGPITARIAALYQDYMGRNTG